MKQAPAIAVIVVFVCIAALTCDVTPEGLVIEITPEQIQRRLDKRFPITKQYLMLLELTLADPIVELREGSDRVGFGVSAATNVRVDGEDLTGRAHMTAAIRYVPERGSLFLVDPSLEQLDISLLPDKYKNAVTQAASLATQEFLDDYEIYKLEQSDFKQRLAKLILRDIVVEDGLLRITLGPKK